MKFKPKTPISEQRNDSSNSTESVTQSNYSISKLLDLQSRPHKIIDFPGIRNENFEIPKIALWNLTDWESRQARIKAIEFIGTLKLPESIITHDPGFLEEEIKIQILFQAMRDSEQPLKPWADSTFSLRTILTPDERESLFCAYLEFVEERSPFKKFLSGKEVDELISAMGKNSNSEIILSYYDSNSLRNICRSLVDKLKTLTNQNSLDSSQSQDSNHSSLTIDPQD